MVSERQCLPELLGRKLGACKGHRKVTALLIWGLSEAVLEIRVPVQIVYLGGGPKNTDRGVRQEREGSRQRMHYRASYPCGNWGTALPGQSGGLVEWVGMSHPAWGGSWGVCTTSPITHQLRVAPGKGGLLILQNFWPATHVGTVGTRGPSKPGAEEGRCRQMRGPVSPEMVRRAMDKASTVPAARARAVCGIQCHFFAKCSVWRMSPERSFSRKRSAFRRVWGKCIL